MSGLLRRLVASQELQDAFRTLVSSDDQRALLASIENESIIPTNTIPLTNVDFTADLHQLQSYLAPTKAAYVLLKTNPGEADGFVAVTFVPNGAPVRQKMLFASTRLTLTRELGIERFRQTIFATDKEELTAAGWAKHEAHEALDAPLTEEESGLKGVKEAEAQESQGTGARRGHVDLKHDVPIGDGVLEALKLLNEEGCKGTLVQLKYILPDETLQLDSSTDNVSPSDLGSAISSTEPRYSFYSHPSASGSQPTILFFYTCPSGSKIKERMLYSTGKTFTRLIAERDAGIAVTKSLEASEPSELAIDDIGGESQQTQAAEESKPASSGFSRPKRPGRR